MKKVKTLRYYSKLGYGVHSGFFKDNLIKDVDMYRREKLLLPKPQNNAEIAMLSKFIFGTELTVRFEYFHDSIQDFLNKSSWRKTPEDIKKIRFIKLWKMNNKKNNIPYELFKYDLRTSDKKIVLVNLRYFCNQEHRSYYDYNFNKLVFKFGSYELDSAFWKHCIGELYCGGIGTYSYGQVDITSFKESERLINMVNNPDQPVRKSFKDKINKLYKLDLEYEESMAV